MTGGDLFWTGVGVLFVLWVLKCIYMRYYGATGRHHDYWMTKDEIIPTGTIWYAHGEWWTQPRRDWPKPRWFDKRSNPLDHEYRYETRQVPPKTIQVPHEVEY